MNEQIKQAFDKVFGDMCLSDNDVAMHIFELGYRAGMEDAAKICNEMVAPMDSYGSFDFAAKRFSEAIMERMK